MVIESGCRPVKVQSERGLDGGGVERKTEKDRKRAEQIERAGFHSPEKHVLFMLNPICCNPVNGIDHRLKCED